MGDNGELERKEEKQESQPIEMRIIAEPGKPVIVHFPLLNDKITTYGFLKMGEKILDAHYAQQKPKIIPVKHGMMDFVRGKR